MSAATPEDLIYDEAIRAIGLQQAMASELRNGAGLVIATAAIAISLLSESLFAGASAPLAWAGLVAFVGVCCSVLAVIWPSSALGAGAEIDSLVRFLTEHRLLGEPDGSSEFRRVLTVSLATQQRLLAQRITTVSRAFRIGLVSLVMQLAATVAARILTS